MNDTPNKNNKLRKSPIGKYIFEKEEQSFKPEPYTIALLNSENIDQLNRSLGIEKKKSRKTRSIYSVPRKVIVPNRDELSVCWVKMKVDGWKPETRQQASLSYLNDKLYLIGGISRSISKDVNVLRLSQQIWIRADEAGEVDPRFGHSAVKYDGNIIVYGGGTHYDSVHSLRECLSGVHIFRSLEMKWEYLKTKGTYLPARKYHSAVIVGKHMFIYGGMNQRNNVLADPAVLNLSSSNWKSVEIAGNGPGKMAFHTSVLVLNPQPNKTEKIHSFSAKSSKIQIAGIYFFGGLNSEKCATNKLYVLSVGKRPLEWISPRVSGRPPSPRFLHTMVYNEKLNLLIIFGGRVDLSNTLVYTCFNDVFIMDMQSLIWITVKVMGEVPLERSGHSAETCDHRMFVFGGVANSCYCGGDVWTLELDTSAAMSLGELYMKKMEMQNAKVLHNLTDI